MSAMFTSEIFGNSGNRTETEKIIGGRASFWGNSYTSRGEICIQQNFWNAYQQEEIEKSTWHISEAPLPPGSSNDSVKWNVCKRCTLSFHNSRVSFVCLACSLLRDQVPVFVYTVRIASMILRHDSRFIVMHKIHRNLLNATPENGTVWGYLSPVLSFVEKNNIIHTWEKQLYCFQPLMINSLCT